MSSDIIITAFLSGFFGFIFGRCWEIWLSHDAQMKRVYGAAKSNKPGGA